MCEWMRSLRPLMPCLGCSLLRPCRCAAVKVDGALNGPCCLEWALDERWASDERSVGLSTAELVLCTVWTGGLGMHGMRGLALIPHSLSSASLGSFYAAAACGDVRSCMRCVYSCAGWYYSCGRWVG